MTRLMVVLFALTTFKKLTVSLSAGKLARNADRLIARTTRFSFTGLQVQNSHRLQPQVAGASALGSRAVLEKGKLNNQRLYRRGMARGVKPWISFLKLTSKRS